jgi:hypothetical protein
VNLFAKHGPTTTLDWWMPGGQKPCWVCGDLTSWAYLDLGYQHLDCDAYPDIEGEFKVVRGEVQE